MEIRKGERWRCLNPACQSEILVIASSKVVNGRNPRCCMSERNLGDRVKQSGKRQKPAVFLRKSYEEALCSPGNENDSIDGGDEAWFWAPYHPVS